MASFIMLKNITLSFGDRTLLDNVSFTLDSNSKVALAGANGSGKSTLMKILMGLQKADDGEITTSQNCRISYMSQSGKQDAEKTIYQIAEEAFEYYFNLEKEIERLDILADEKSLIKRSELHQILIDDQFYDRASTIDMILTGLGYKKDDFNKELKSFSSGWRMRSQLAKSLLANADILILDEPSNYLDIESSTFLIDFIKRFKGGVLLVSHDRYFLDSTTNQTLELFNGKLKVYSAKYSDYEKRKEQEIELLIAQKEAQDDRIKQIEDFVRKFGASATKASQAQSRVKELEKMDIIEIPESLKKVHINFPKAPHSGERVYYTEDLSKKYGDKTIFSNLTFLINRGEKLALVGKNGAGKSTLMRIIAGIEKETSGFTKQGTGVQIGYFSEDTHEPFKGATVEEELSLSANVAMQPQLRSLLGAFLFRGDDIYKPVATLSGGEKARVLLAKLFLSPFNLLLLDEPTNHLDLQAKDALLEALKKYDGTVIFVSHDRYFLDELASHVLLVGTQIEYFHGGYGYFLEKTGSVNDVNLVKKDKVITSNQLNREEDKKAKAENRKKEKELALVLEKIDKLESEKKELDSRLADADVYSNGDLTKEYLAKIKNIESEINVLYEKWEELSVD